MELHGLALTDPIRQFNDYGYTMCSTIAGINCAIWDAMGLRAKYWDISLHTVSGGRIRRPLAHVRQQHVGALHALRRPDHRRRRGHRQAGRVRGFRRRGGTGPHRQVPLPDGHQPARLPHGRRHDAQPRRRRLAASTRTGSKYRSYFYDWDRGHRYILNLRDHESYTRYYRSLGQTRGFYVPNDGKDPEKVNERYRIRGNGIRVFTPALTAEELATSAHCVIQRGRVERRGRCARRRPDQAGEVVFKVEGANVITSLQIRGRCPPANRRRREPHRGQHGQRPGLEDRLAE